MTGNQKTLDPDAVNIKDLTIVQQHFFIVDRHLRQLIEMINNLAAYFSDQIPVLDLADVQIRIPEQPRTVCFHRTHMVGVLMGDKDISDKLMQQYGITVKESRGQLSYLPSGRTKFIRARHLGDKFDKAAVLATLQANAERKPKAQFKQDTIGKLIDIQSRMTEGKGIGYKRWLTKHNLKVMAQTVKLLQEKGLTDEDALNQRIAELETKYHDTLAVVKDLEGRMKANKELRYHVAAYTSTKNVAQQLKTAKRPAAFEEQHRAELTAYRAAAAYFKANNITKLPSPKKLEAEYAQLASEKAKFYEQYKEAKEELLKLKTAKQNVASFFREEEPAQQER